MGRPGTGGGHSVNHSGGGHSVSRSGGGHRVGGSRSSRPMGGSSRPSGGGFGGGRRSTATTTKTLWSTTSTTKTLWSTTSTTTQRRLLREGSKTERRMRFRDSFMVYCFSYNYHCTGLLYGSERRRKHRKRTVKQL